MMDEDEFIPRDDTTPKLEEQARLNGWKAGIFNFGKAEQEGVSYFNPGLIRRPDGLWLLTRRSIDDPNMPYGRNDICAFRLKEPELMPTVGYPLKFLDSDAEEQFEDPRVLRFKDQTWVSAINFTWFGDGSWTGAHICLGYFRDDEEWTPIARRDPEVGTNLGHAGHTNGRHNKNLLWFFHDEKLHLIYTSDPWHVVEFGSSWEEQTHHRYEGAKWQYGHIRGGTPPIRVGDLFWTFFHSSLPWRGRFRRYYAGAMAFEAKPPFKPVFVTPEPLLTGSQNDIWGQKKPLVVFPCGAIYENEHWLITYGVNDLRSGWARIPHEDVVKLAQPPPPAPASLLLATETPRAVCEPAKAELKGGDEPCAYQQTSVNSVTKSTATATNVGASDAAPTSEPEGAANNGIIDLMRTLAAKKKRQAAAAKARATLAEMRAKGIPIKTRGKRRIKHRKRKILKQRDKGIKSDVQCQRSPKPEASLVAIPAAEIPTRTV